MIAVKLMFSVKVVKPVCSAIAVKLMLSMKAVKPVFLVIAVMPVFSVTNSYAIVFQQ